MAQQVHHFEVIHIPTGESHGYWPGADEDAALKYFHSADPSADRGQRSDWKLILDPGYAKSVAKMWEDQARDPFEEEAQGLAFIRGISGNPDVDG